MSTSSASRDSALFVPRRRGINQSRSTANQKPVRAAVMQPKHLLYGGHDNDESVCLNDEAVSNATSTPPTVFAAHGGKHAPLLSPTRAAGRIGYEIPASPDRDRRNIGYQGTSANDANMASATRSGYHHQEKSTATNGRVVWRKKRSKAARTPDRQSPSRHGVVGSEESSDSLANLTPQQRGKAPPATTDRRQSAYEVRSGCSSPCAGDKLMSTIDVGFDNGGKSNIHYYYHHDSRDGLANSVANSAQLDDASAGKTGVWRGQMRYSNGDLQYQYQNHSSEVNRKEGAALKEELNRSFYKSCGQRKSGNTGNRGEAFRRGLLDSPQEHKFAVTSNDVQSEHSLAFLDCDNTADFLAMLPNFEICDRFQLISELGRGTFASVMLARRIVDRKLLALKLYAKDDIDPHDFQRELTISYFLSPCKFIVKTLAQAFRSRDFFVLQMEPCLGPDLYHVIMESSPRGLNDFALKEMAFQASRALLFLHSRHLTHRDVKVENFVYATPALRLLKLCDFGHAKRIGAPARRCSAPTVPYTPPEICSLREGQFYAVSASQDVWSFAVTLYCAAVAKFPWMRADAQADPHYQAFISLHKTGKHQVANSASWCLLTTMFRKLLHSLLDPDPASRSTLDVLQEFELHQWKHDQVPRNDSSTTNRQNSRYKPSRQPTVKESKSASKLIENTCNNDVGGERPKTLSQNSSHVKFTDDVRKRAIDGAGSDPEEDEELAPLPVTPVFSLIADSEAEHGSATPTTANAMLAGETPIGKASSNSKDSCLSSSLGNVANPLTQQYTKHSDGGKLHCFSPYTAKRVSITGVLVAADNERDRVKMESTGTNFSSLHDSTHSTTDMIWSSDQASSFSPPKPTLIDEESARDEGCGRKADIDRPCIANARDFASTGDNEQAVDPLGPLEPSGAAEAGQTPARRVSFSEHTQSQDAAERQRTNGDIPHINGTLVSPRSSSSHSSKRGSPCSSIVETTTCCWDSQCGMVSTSNSHDCFTASDGANDCECAGARCPSQSQMDPLPSATPHSSLPHSDCHVEASSARHEVDEFAVTIERRLSQLKLPLNFDKQQKNAETTDDSGSGAVFNAPRNNSLNPLEPIDISSSSMSCADSCDIDIDRSHLHTSGDPTSTLRASTFSAETFEDLPCDTPQKSTSNSVKGAAALKIVQLMGGSMLAGCGGGVSPFSFQQTAAARGSNIVNSNTGESLSLSNPSTPFSRRKKGPAVQKAMCSLHRRQTQKQSDQTQSSCGLGRSFECIKPIVLFKATQPPPRPTATSSTTARSQRPSLAVDEVDYRRQFDVLPPSVDRTPNNHTASLARGGLTLNEFSPPPVPPSSPRKANSWFRRTSRTGTDAPANTEVSQSIDMVSSSTGTGSTKRSIKGIKFTFIDEEPTKV